MTRPWKAIRRRKTKELCAVLVGWEMNKARVTLLLFPG